MINLSKQSGRRAALRKTKGLILASLIAGLMAVPSSVLAQLNNWNCTPSITDDSQNSPSSWTLDVTFSLGGPFYCSDQNISVLSSSPVFQPFDISVMGMTNGAPGGPIMLWASFGQTVGGIYNYGSFGLPDLGSLQVGTTSVPQVGGNAATIAGFLYCSVTVTRANTDPASLATVTVTFSNGQSVLIINPAINLITLWNVPGGNGLIAKLNTIQAQISNGNVTTACSVLNAFIQQVGAMAASGNLTPGQEAQLLGIAAAIQPLIPGC